MFQTQLVIMLLSLITLSSLVNTNKIVHQELEPDLIHNVQNELFCEWSEKEIQNSSQSKNKLPLLKKILNSIISRNKYIEGSEYTLSCSNKNQVISMIFATIGRVSKNACLDNSTITSLVNETTSQEAIKSTKIITRLCDSKTKCDFKIDRDFASICKGSDENSQRYLNIVYTCNLEKKEDQILKRSKRLNKWESDARTRFYVKNGPILSFPNRYQYDFMQPYSFHHNREAWETGFYDYYNYYNYFDYDDNYIDDNYIDYYGNN